VFFSLGCSQNPEDTVESVEQPVLLGSEITAGATGLYPLDMITLTYDDGPDAYTLDLAQYLHDQNIRATFFIRTCRLEGQVPDATRICALGNLCTGPVGGPYDCTHKKQWPVSILQQLVDLGHHVASHTRDHFSLPTIADDQILKEIRLAQPLIDNVVKDELFMLRAPYDGWSEHVGSVVQGASDLNKITGPIGEDWDGCDWGCVVNGRDYLSGVCDYNACVPGSIPAKECADVNYAGKLNDRIANHQTPGIVIMHAGNEFAVGLPYPLDVTKEFVSIVRQQYPNLRFVPIDTVPGVLPRRRFDVMTQWSSEFSDASGWGTSVGYWGTIRYGNVDGLGGADVCGRQADGIYCAKSNGPNSQGFAPSTKWLGPDFSDSDGWSPERYSTTIQLADLNKDGKADICGRGIDGIYCALSNGKTGFSSKTRWTTDFSDAGNWGSQQSYFGSIRLVDLNADGRADICGRGTAGIYCALARSDGKPGFGAIKLWTSDFSDSKGWLPAQYGSTIQFGDVNKDGYVDVCGRAIDGVWCGLGLKTRDGFAASKPWLTGPFSDAQGWAASRARYGSFSLADVNGDGVSDVCGRGETGIVCAFSDKTSFKGFLHLRNDYYTDSQNWGQDMYGSTIRLADVSGDKKADICGRGTAGLYCSPFFIQP
jgi:hypothetical protein